jgi:hypothetical protein
VEARGEAVGAAHRRHLLLRRALGRRPHRLW